MLSLVVVAEEPVAEVKVKVEKSALVEKMSVEVAAVIVEEVAVKVLAFRTPVVVESPETT